MSIDYEKKTETSTNPPKLPGVTDPKPRPAPTPTPKPDSNKN